MGLQGGFPKGFDFRYAFQFFQNFLSPPIVIIDFRFRLDPNLLSQSGIHVCYAGYIQRGVRHFWRSGAASFGQKTGILGAAARPLAWRRAVAHQEKNSWCIRGVEMTVATNSE